MLPHALDLPFSKFTINGKVQFNFTGAITTAIMSVIYSGPSVAFP